MQGLPKIHSSYIYYNRSNLVYLKNTITHVNIEAV